MSSNYEAAVEIREAIDRLGDMLTMQSPAVQQVSSPAPKQQVFDISAGTSKIMAEMINDWLEKHPGWKITSVSYQCHPSDVAYAKGTMHYALVLAELTTGG